MRPLGSAVFTYLLRIQLLSWNRPDRLFSFTRFFTKYACDTLSESRLKIACRRLDRAPHSDSTTGGDIVQSYHMKVFQQQCEYMEPCGLCLVSLAY